jgi:transposase
VHFLAVITVQFLIDIYIKQYRAIATRYDKLATSFLGAIYLASIVTWLN